MNSTYSPLHLGLFVLPQISPIATADVKQFLDKEIALSCQKWTAMPWQASGVVTKPGAMGPCRSTHGGGLLRAWQSAELWSPLDISHPLGSSRLPQPEGNLNQQLGDERLRILPLTPGDGPFPTARAPFFPWSSLLSPYIIKQLLDHIFISLFPSWHSLCMPWFTSRKRERNAHS